MDAESIIVGNTYQCSSPLLEQHFEGVIEKVYASSALVKVSQFSTVDHAKVQDLNKKIIIPFALINALLTTN